MKTKLKLMTTGLVIGLYGLLFSACAPVFSELQSARTAGKNKTEVTAGYSYISAVDQGENGERQRENVQDHIGLQVAYGITENFDMRMRLEHLWVADEGGNTNIIGIGPKYEFIDNWLSFYVPVGFAFGGDIEDGISDTWEVHPTMLLTIPAHKNIELNTSTKYIHALQKDGWRFMAFNLGLGLSTDLTKYVIRPEVGWAWDVQNGGSDDPFRQFSVGLTLYPAAFNKDRP